MDIILRDTYKSINPFEVHDLPDLVVLTGENGTGKTQLLTHLFATSQGVEDIDSDNIESIELTDEGIGRESSTGMNESKQAEILVDGVVMKNIVFREVQAPTVDLGGNTDLRKIYECGINLAQKHLFYSTHVASSDIEKTDLSILSNSFNKALGVKRGSRPGQDTEFPQVTQSDIDMIHLIESNFPQDNFTKDPFYYIAFQPLPETTVFAANMKFLYFQYWARWKAGMDLGAKPWEVFNEIGDKLGFQFELDEPKVQDPIFDVKNFNVRLRDKSRKRLFISPDSLSSGEKVIFSLFVAMYTTNINEHHPSVMLFDEPDAYLHPSLSRMMLDVMQDVFIKKYNIKVILTTHSPSTVALAPEQSIYKMDKDSRIMVKSSKKDAILALTSGLNTLSVYYENIKQVFVEADNDNRYYTQVFHHGVSMGLLNAERQLKFVNVGNDKNGGCDTLKRIVNDLAGADNQTVYGIIDWDGKNSSDARIKVLGCNKRYAIDNYYSDPITVSLILIHESKEKIKIGFDEFDSFTTFGKKSNTDVQNIIDSIITELEKVIPTSERTDTTLYDYTLADNRTFKLPRWFMICQGHKMIEYYRLAFPVLKKYRTEKEILEKVYEAYNNFPEIIPMDVIDTLKEVQLSD